MLKFAHKHLCNALPDLLQCMSLEKNTNERLRNEEDYRLPVYRTDLGKTRVIYKVSEFLNKLDPLVKAQIGNTSMASLVGFMRRELIGKYDPICRIANCYICDSTPEEPIIPDIIVNRPP